VFAVVLQEMKKEEDYELVRVSVLKELDEITAYHVYALRGQHMVDVCGIRAEEEYLDWLTAKHVEKVFDGRKIPKITCHKTTTAELLDRVRNDARLGWVNQWEFFTDKDFIHRATERAKMLIEHWPEKYAASLVVDGQKLRKEYGLIRRSPEKPGLTTERSEFEGKPRQSAT
jgi:hypothetical protein